MPETREVLVEAVAHAMNSDYCVLEFEEVSGEMQIRDITDHVQSLEEGIQE